MTATLPRMLWTARMTKTQAVLPNICTKASTGHA